MKNEYNFSKLYFLKTVTEMHIQTINLTTLQVCKGSKSNNKFANIYIYIYSNVSNLYK